MKRRGAGSEGLLALLLGVLTYCKSGSSDRRHCKRQDTMKTGELGSGSIREVSCSCSENHVHRRTGWPTCKPGCWNDTMRLDALVTASVNVFHHQADHTTKRIMIPAPS